MTNKEFFILLLRHLPQILFAKEPFDVSFDGITLRAHPRSSAFFILWETYVWKVYTPVRSLGEVKLVLDIGGYIGDFTVWAARQYKPKKIIVLEPKKSLYELLIHNIKKNKTADITVALKKAVYTKVTTLKDDKSKIRDASSEFATEDERGNVETVTLKKVLQENKVGVIDYFKLDIEGGEKFVLTEENKGIFRERVRFISIETHDKWGFTKKDAVRYLESLGYEIVERGARGQFAQFECYNRAFFRK